MYNEHPKDRQKAKIIHSSHAQCVWLFLLGKALVIIKKEKSALADFSFCQL